MRAIVNFFIKRHFLVHVMVAVVVVVGLSAVMTSQREGFPAVTLNQLIVTATLPGASAQDIETKITLPLEDAIDGVDGVEEYNSMVTDNVSITTVEIYDDWSPQQVREVQSDLRQAIDGVRDFPDDMEDMPTVTRVEPAKMPVLEIALEGPSHAVKEAARQLERRIERVQGVSNVTLVGVEDPEVRILLDSASARTYGVDLGDIISAIGRRNVSGTGGIVESNSDRKQVVVNARFSTPDKVAATPLRVNPDGGIVTVGDVARVELTTEDNGLRVHTNGHPGVSVVIRKKADADIITAVDAVKVAAEAIDLPQGVETSYIGDQSLVVRNRLGVMTSNGLVGIVLVVLVLGLFLTRKAAIWVAVGVPMVLLGVLILLPFVGITLNLISLAGLVMVLGLLVDDAVVIADRVVHEQTAGTSDTPEADAVASVALPVTASAITTSLAFTPMLAIGGMAGKVVWALPIVVVLALIVSLMESFFVLPTHLHEKPEKRATLRATPKRKFVVTLERIYRRTLGHVLRLRYLVVVGFIGLFAFVVGVLGPRIGFDLFPQDDSEALYIKINMPLGTPIEQTEAVATAIERQLPPVMGASITAVTARVGHQDGAAIDRLTGSAENEAVVIALLDTGHRGRSAAQWAEHLGGVLDVPAGAELVFEAKLVGPPLGSAATIHIATNDDELRRSNAARVRDWLETIEGVVDIEIDERPGIRQIELAPDPEKLAMRGLDASLVAFALKAAFHGLTVSEHRTLDDTTRFRVMFAPEARVDLDALLDTPVRARNGVLVSLRDVVSPVEVAAVSRMYHRDGVRTATVTASLSPDSDLDSTRLAKRIDKELLPALSDNIALDIYQGGEATETKKTNADMGRAGALAVFGMVVVVAIMLGSFVDALLVVSVIPFGIAGVVAAFYLHGKPLSMFAVLGIIGLSGVVVNASIVMLDAAKQRQAAASADAASQRTAIIEAVVERLRPILVTTLTTLGGVMPTAYGLGGYDAVLSPMSLALGWGLVFASSITLLLVPSLFAIAEDLRALFRRSRSASAPADATQPGGH